MTTKPKAAATPQYEPDVTYKVTLKERVPFRSKTLLPGKEYEMLGSVCIDLKDQIETAEPVNAE